jgi:uncharacterized membrane protein YuzA (DUF378 family)
MAITHTEAHAVGARPRTRGNMNALDWIAMVLLIIGGLNWGLVGIADFNLVAAIFGDDSAISRIVYILVGLSALWTIYTATKVGSRERYD